MKISYNWLKELLPDLTASPKQVAELLTMHSFETEVTGTLSVSPKVLIAKISQLKPHPNADRLQLATIETGQDKVTVICGAPNIYEGAIVPYSPPGTELSDETGTSFTVKEAVIREVASPGMLNSLRELRLGDEHGGIWLLPEDLPLSGALVDQLPPDTILNAEVTPNRAHDCLSHIGLARELAALLQLTVTEPTPPDLPKPKADVAGWTVAITNPRLCSRYLGVVLDQLQIRPSSLAIQAKLLASGGKPINNLVDITNYVMFEYGNPTHLFDQALMPGQDIAVRLASSGEQLTTLDEVKQDLTSADLVVTAAGEPVALAGIMGGATSAIGDTTQSAWLETANFSPWHVQETARRLATRSESSARFSKGLHPRLVELAARRATSLLQEQASANVIGVIDAYPEPRPNHTISFRPERAADVAGVKITPRQSQETLERLRCEVSTTTKPWQVSVPFDRLDLVAEHDLVEEVLRIFGLENIKASGLSGQVKPQPLPKHIYWREVIRELLAGLGLTETYNYSFEHQRYFELAQANGSPHLEIVNPAAPELRNLRTSLLPGLLYNLTTNKEAFNRQVGTKESALFEIGNVFSAGEGGRVPGVIEEEHLAAVIVGQTPSLTTIAQTLGDQLGLASPELSNIITAKLAQQLKYRVPLHGFEINLTELITRLATEVPPTPSLAKLKAQPTAVVRYQPIAKYPALYRDLSVLVDPDVTVEQVQEVIEQAGGELVSDVDLFDTYDASQDKHASDLTTAKSLAFHIVYQALDHTLTTEEVARVHNQIMEQLKDQLSAVMRD